MDEAQIEVTKSLVEWKWFSKESLGWYKADTQEEQEKVDKDCKNKVEQWKKEKEQETGKIWANVHESPKGGWFTAYSRAGELTSISVLEAGRYYGLNIDLSAEYDLGQSWRDCH